MTMNRLKKMIREELNGVRQERETIFNDPLEWAKFMYSRKIEHKYGEVVRNVIGEERYLQALVDAGDGKLTHNRALIVLLDLLVAQFSGNA